MCAKNRVKRKLLIVICFYENITRQNNQNNNNFLQKSTCILTGGPGGPFWAKMKINMIFVNPYFLLL